MTEPKLDLSLPDRGPAPARRTSNAPTWLLALVLVTVLAHLAIGVIGMRRSADGNAQLAVDSSKQLALRLEEQGLAAPAVAEWKNYLRIADLDRKGAARIWYRIANLQRDSADYEDALRSFYTSEAFAEIPGISSEIARSVQECLEKSGRFAALRRELSGRTAVGESGAAGGKVVAELGGWKITESELDARIERSIRNQLESYAAFLPEEQRLQQQEEMLKNASSGPMRDRFLQQLLMEELLYRKAREDGLAEQDDVRARLEEQERSLLAQEVLQHELAARINITPTDLQSYYQANKAGYVEKERVAVAQIVVPSEEAVEIVLRRLDAGEAFDVVAAEVSSDERARNAGGKVQGWITRGEPATALGQATPVPALFETEVDALCAETLKSEKGLHVVKILEKRPERMRPFDEARDDVFRALRAAKEREVQQQLFQSLTSKYDLVVHRSARGTATPTETPAPAP